MAIIKAAFDKSLPCNPPPVTAFPISDPNFLLVAPVSTFIPPVHSPNGFIIADAINRRTTANKLFSTSNIW